MCMICVGAQDGSAMPQPMRPDVHADRYAAGIAFLAGHATIDLHAHPGRFFMQDAPASPFTGSYPAPDPGSVIDDMRHGGLSGAFFATVADLPVLGRGARGMGATRGFAPGEALADHQRQVDVALATLRAHDLPLGANATDVRLAHRNGSMTGFLSVEGGDFVEDRLDRIADAAARGVRLVTLIHYRTNQIGDTQTEAPVHGGLTPLGRDIIRAMQAADILVDLSHASLDTVRAATAHAMRPMVLSHSNVGPVSGSHPG